MVTIMIKPNMAQSLLYQAPDMCLLIEFLYPAYKKALPQLWPLEPTNTFWGYCSW